MFFDLTLEKSLRENMRVRAKLLQECDKDPIMQACVMRKCKDDPVYFFEHFVWTMKNDTFFSADLPRNIPFVPFEYQKELIWKIWEDITTGKNLFIEKSRQMGITWLLMGIYLYGFIFHRHRYLIVSQKEEYVDKAGDMRSCFEKLRFFCRMLPTWMLPEGFDAEVGTTHNKFMAMSLSDGSSITGESANPNAGTGGTYHSIFLDEMSKMNHATQINTACAAATPCIIYNSTPLGEGNEYYRMRLKAKAGKIDGVTLHWSLHPMYTREWYDWKTAGMTPEKVAQELEISYNASIEGAVYRRFQPVPHGDVEFGQFEYDYKLPLFCSIDNSHGGKDNHAYIVFQTTPEGKIRIIDTVQLPPQTSITEAASFIAKQPLAGIVMDDYTFGFFSRWKIYKPATFISDPYDAHSTWNNSSVAKEYAKYGITLLTPKTIQ